LKNRKGEFYNAEICAEFIQKAVGGDLFEIKTVKAYDADYYKCIDEAKKELNSNARPQLQNYLESIAEFLQQ
jgi:flavodoxin